MPNEGKGIRRWAPFVSVYVALLPISVLIVAITTDRPLTWYLWVLAPVALDLILGIWLSCVCMILGYAVRFLVRDSTMGDSLIRFGAGLAVVFFSIGMIFAIVMVFVILILHDHDSQGS